VFENNFAFTTSALHNLWAMRICNSSLNTWISEFILT